MTVALRDPGIVSALIPVDNAPADALLKSDFAKYVQGMRKIEDAKVTKQTEADDIMKLYEEVRKPLWFHVRCIEILLPGSPNPAILAHQLD